MLFARSWSVRTLAPLVLSLVACGGASTIASAPEGNETGAPPPAVTSREPPSPVFGATRCLPCPAGAASPPGSAWCRACAAGTFAAAEGAAQCAPCAPGTDSRRAAKVCKVASATKI